MHIATYQTLGIDTDGDNASFLTRHYPPDHFSHIVIDECHRSAWGRWSAVLTRNPAAVQIGLTATPRLYDCGEDTGEARADAAITADNHRYFGLPAYEYGLAQAMEDGYLAACEIDLAQVNLDATGLSLPEIVRRNPRDANTGRPVSASDIAKLYERTDYETHLLLPDRVRAMCWDLFQQMLASDPVRGPEQKTIIFCARDRHADDVAREMNNLYAHWCATQGRRRGEPYAFKCTAEAGNTKSLIADLKGSSTSHFIATTVDLLSTGVDVPAIRNLAFFRYMKSPISFYQMIGRGTRIDIPSEKLMFRVYDYTGATRLFGQSFAVEPKSSGTGEDGEPLPPGPPPPPPPPIITVDGFDVHITPLGRYVVMPVNGVAMPVPIADYKAGLSETLIRECATLASFRSRWIVKDEREEVMTAVTAAGYSPGVLRLLEDKNDFDLYDVLADLAYGLAPRTRQDRAFAFRYKHAAWLAGFPAAARGTLEALADQFTLGGTEALENQMIFQIPEVQAAGGLPALKAAGEPKALIEENQGKDLRGVKTSMTWPVVKLGRHVKKLGSGITPKGGHASYKKSGIPLIRSQNVHLNRFETDGLAFISPQQDEAMNGSRVQSGDVLLNITGASIGRVCVVPAEYVPANVNQHVSIIRSDGSWDSRFLSYYLSQPDFQKKILTEQAGATRQALTKALIEEFDVPLPPLPEQRRIAASLTAALAAVEQARQAAAARLAAAEALPAAYLREIFEGPASEAWDEVELLSLCEGKGQYGTSQPSIRDGDGVPVLGMYQIHKGALRWERLSYADPSACDLVKYTLSHGDILFNRTNSAELVGKTTVYERKDKAIFASYLIRFRMNRAKANPWFVSFFINSPTGRSYIEANMTRAIGQVNISASTMHVMPLRAPSVEEQDSIVSQLRHRMQQAALLADSCRAELAAIEALPAAFLRQAFGGAAAP